MERVEKNHLKNQNMKAIVLNGNMEVQVKDVSIPTLENNLIAPKKYDTSKTLIFPKEELVLLEVKAASICGTDLHILEGTHGSAPPVVLGHEYVGEVLKVGKFVKNVKPGDLVGVDPNIKCGVCRFCRDGHPNMCRDLTTLGIFINGGFAKYNIAPAKQLYVLPADLALERAVFFEPMSCALHAFEKISPTGGDEVLIYGAGPIGCVFAMLCELYGASKIVMVEPSEYRRNLATTLGVLAIRPDEEPPDEEYDLIIDACGKPQVLIKAVELTRPGGKISLFGEQNINSEVTLNPTKINQKELQIYGSYAAASSFLKTAKILGELQLEKLVTHRFSLNQSFEAFRLIETGQALEIIFFP